MNLCLRFCGLKATPSLLGAGRAVLFFKALRRFFDAEKPIERFATFLQSNFNPSIALCAASQ